jgi:chemotaxis protein MotB
MRRTTKPQEEEQPSGAPEWMVTFSDCMTLLLTFFVLLLSFSSFDVKVFRRLRVIYCKAFNNIAPVVGSDSDALLPLPRIKYTDELDKGSEKPTSQDGLTDGLMKETRLADLQAGMAFIIPSKRLFWGRGAILSSEGRHIMDTMGAFLRGVPSRIVINESGPKNDPSGGYAGLPRAWSLMQYLTTEQNIDGTRFSLSAADALSQAGQHRANTEPAPGRSEPERTVEIVLLEWSMQN